MSQPTVPASSELSRLTGVFHEPGAVMPDVAQKGRWWLPTILMALIGLVIGSIMVNRIGVDQIIRQGMEQSERAQQLSAEQREQAIEAQRKFVPIAIYAGPPVATIAMVLVTAAALLFIFKLMLGGELTYKNSLNVTAYGMWPPGLIGSLVMIAVMYLKPPDEFNVQKPLAFNAGAFLPETAPKWLASLGTSLDVFTFWTIALLAIGFSAACGKKKMPTGRALGGILAGWAIWVIAKMGWASVFG